jgi:hypothetical protein
MSSTAFPLAKTSATQNSIAKERGGILAIPPEFNNLTSERDELLGKFPEKDVKKPRAKPAVPESRG